MPHARANGLELYYESFGAPADPTVLLVMGFGVQLLGWDEGLCRRLADRGLRVVRFDNRDVGLSARCGALGPYTLDDMADDAVGLLDALGVEAGHLVGASMGGMIAQLAALRHRARVRSLTSVMSTTSRHGVGWPRPDVMWTLVTPAPSERAAFVEHMARVSRALGSPRYPVDDRALRERIAAGYDRAYHPAGVARQARALFAAWDRTEALARIDVPTAVVHGEDDPLVQVDGGVATAAAIPGATLHRVPGMGHDLPAALWPLYVDVIADTVASGERLSAPRP